MNPPIESAFCAALFLDCFYFYGGERRIIELILILWQPYLIQSLLFVQMNPLILKGTTQPK
jgi:hypothetical protein